MEVVVAISTEKLNLLTAMPNSKPRIIMEDVYLSTILIFPRTLSSH